MSLPPSGTILVNKVNGSNNFVEDILDVTDLVPLLQGQYVTLTGAQTVSGVKTFNSPPNLSSLAISGNLRLDASRNITTGAIDLANADVSGVLPIANGGTNNAALSVAAGSVYYGDGTRIIARAPTTSGQILTLSGGLPVWSGVPASVTSLNGSVSGVQVFSTSTTGTNFTITTSANTHTFSIPDASATARGLVTTGAQTLNGVKTFNDNILGPGLRFTSSIGTISANTADAADTGRSLVQGGGNNTSNMSTRGAYLDLYGNESTGSGIAVLGAGNVAQGSVRLHTAGTQPVEVFTSNQLRFSLDGLGNETLKSYGTSSFSTGTGSVRTVSVVTTSNSTPTTLFQLSLNNNTTYTFEVAIVGRHSSASDKGITGQLRFGVYRNNSGAAIIIGTRIREVDTYGSTGLSEYDFDVTVAGNNVRILVTGFSDDIAFWMAEVKYIGVSVD